MLARAGLAGAALIAWPAASMGWQTAPDRGADRKDAAELAVSALTTPGTPPAEVKSAAQELVALALAKPEGAMAAALVLDQSGTAPEGARAVLIELAGSWNPPARVFRRVVELAADPVLGVAAIEALGSFRDREAAEVLIQNLGPEHPEERRRAAQAALTRLTGLERLGADQAAWSDWLAGTRNLSDSDWRDLLSENVWRRAERLRAEAASSGARLAEIYRRLYLALPAGEERSRLLVQMLRDSRADLRNVGLEIVSREVSAGNLVNGPVTEAVLLILSSDDPRLRTRAATLVAQLGPAGAQEALVEALGRETDAGAARALLAGVARFPSREARPALLRWLAHRNAEVIGAAADAALALRKAGLLDESDGAAVVAALRDVPTPQLGGAACRLLAEYGRTADRDRIASLLQSDSVAARLAAAEAIAGRPEYADAIIRAARQDGALFEAAIAAAQGSSPGPSRFQELLALPAPTPEARIAGLGKLAALMSSRDLVEAASATLSDPVMVDLLLSQLIGRDGSDEAMEDVWNGLFMLAQARVALNRPEAALAALDQMPGPVLGEMARRAADLRCLLLVWLNRVDEASRLGLTPSIWLDGLERALREPHAWNLLRTVRNRFGTTLGPEDSARLAKLEVELRARQPEGSAGAMDEMGPPFEAR